MATEELNWQGFTNAVTWPTLWAEIEDLHNRILAYIQAHPDAATIPADVAAIIGGACAVYPSVKYAVLDVDGLTKNPPPAVTTAVLRMARQARRVLP